MDSEESEEEILVFAEFGDSVNIEMYRSVHVLGITEKNPIIQMDDTFFTGKYVNPLGTCMFFEQDPSPHSSDPVFDKLPERNLKYLFKTQKLLNMEHAYVRPRHGEETSVKSEPDDDLEIINFRSVQEALDKFKNEFNKDSATKTDESLEMSIDDDSEKNK